LGKGVRPVNAFIKTIRYVTYLFYGVFPVFSRKAVVMSTNSEQQRFRLTRIELLVVFAILATVVLLVLPGIQKVRERNAQMQTMDNLKAVALTLHNCNDTYKRLPPAWGPFPPPPVGTPATGRSGTIHYWLLPFFEADSTLRLGKAESAESAGAMVWALPHVYSLVIPQYVSPSDFTSSDGKVMLSGAIPWGAGNIAANTRVFGGLKASASATAWDNKARIPASFPDGAFDTIVFATRYASCGTPPGGSAWAGGNTTASFANFTASGAFFGSDIEDMPRTEDGYATSPPFQVAPTQTDCNPLFAQAYSPVGIQIALADGSVRWVSPSISPKAWGRGCHPSCDKNLGGSEWR